MKLLVACLTGCILAIGLVSVSPMETRQATVIPSERDPNVGDCGLHPPCCEFENGVCNLHAFCLGHQWVCP